MSPLLCSTYLEHLNKWNRKIEVRLVAQDQAATEQEANRQDGAEENIFGNIDILDTI